MSSLSVVADQDSMVKTDNEKRSKHLQRGSETESSDNEHQKLQDEVRSIISQIREVKESIFHLYEATYRTQDVFEDYLISNKDRVSESISLISKKQLYDNKSSFYESFMKIETDNKQTFITVLFPQQGKELYGLKFIATSAGIYKLDSCFLPFSLDNSEERATASDLTLENITDYLYNVKKNIYAYYIRQDQSERFKKLCEGKITFYHDIKYTTVDLKFFVHNNGTKKRHLINVELKYDVLQTLPDKMMIDVDKRTIEKDLYECIQDRCEHFKSLELPDTFKYVFINNKQFQFLM